MRASFARNGPASKAVLGAGDLGKAHVLGEEMRRDQHQTADAMILDGAGIDRGNRGAVAVPEQQTAAEIDGGEHAREHIARLLVHEGDRARQLRRRRAAIARARIGEHAGAGRRGKPAGKAPPHVHAAQALMQQHEGRRGSGGGPIMRYSSRMSPRSRKPWSASVMVVAPAIRPQLASSARLSQNLGRQNLGR